MDDAPETGQGGFPGLELARSRTHVGHVSDDIMVQPVRIQPHHAFSTYQTYDEVGILNSPMFDTVVDHLRNEIQPRRFWIFVSRDVF